uniref:THAP-type domain-containing protein n=1 Tax=Cyprinus carpio TaxID=7962 RepID=A0A8C1R8J8_CYPCA
MVRKCAFPGCPNREKLTSKRKGALTLPQNERLTFHRFPSNDRERLNLWLLAVQRDSGPPVSRSTPYRSSSTSNFSNVLNLLSWITMKM